MAERLASAGPRQRTLAPSDTRAGRNCPLSYRYTAQDIARDTPHETECAYVIGGLYGNVPALDAISELAARESTPPLLIFNGDFNWFDIDHLAFAALNRRVLAHTALRGNVETELANDDPAAGCGCAYPESVSDPEVERSNRILDELRAVARQFPELRTTLAALPMHAVACVGGVRVAIVHGDCESLAGWGLSQEALRSDRARERAAWWCEQAQVRAIASSHSCLPIAAELQTPRGACAVFNNGAAGMPNFEGERCGLITRISVRPAARAVHSLNLDGTWIEGIAVAYDHQRWMREFLASWPQGSPAYESYYQRIMQGPHYTADRAYRVRSHA